MKRPTRRRRQAGALIDREKKMPAALAQARENLASPPRIYTEIAIEQIDGNISFFKDDVPAAFKDVTDTDAPEEFKKTNDGVIAALTDTRRFCRRNFCRSPSGTFAFGAETYRKALVGKRDDRSAAGSAAADRREGSPDERSRVPGDRRRIDPTQDRGRGPGGAAGRSSGAAKLLETTQDTLDSLRQFIIDHHIVTIPPSEPARVKETPPFMRSTTSASMDTPGPFETAKLGASTT